MYEVIAIKDYNSNIKNVLSFKKDQKMPFRPYNEKWYISTINGTTGYVPKSFLKFFVDDITIKQEAAISVSKNLSNYKQLNPSSFLTSVLSFANASEEISKSKNLSN